MVSASKKGMLSNIQLETKRTTQYSSMMYIVSVIQMSRYVNSNRAM